MSILEEKSIGAHLVLFGVVNFLVGMLHSTSWCSKLPLEEYIMGFSAFEKQHPWLAKLLLTAQKHLLWKNEGCFKAQAYPSCVTSSPFFWASATSNPFKAFQRTTKSKLSF